MSQHSVDLRSAGAKDFLAAHPTCWICGHPIPAGTGQIDHYYAVSTHPHLAYEVWNWRAAHGVHGCPACPKTVSSDKRRHGKTRKCNQQRSNRIDFQPDRPTSRRW